MDAIAKHEVEIPSSRWLDIHGVKHATGLSKATIYRTRELRRVQMSTRRSLWLASEVEQFIAARIAERDASKVA